MYSVCDNSGNLKAFQYEISGQNNWINFVESAGGLHSLGAANNWLFNSPNEETGDIIQFLSLF